MSTGSAVADAPEDVQSTVDIDIDPDSALDPAPRPWPETVNKVRCVNQAKELITTEQTYLSRLRSFDALLGHGSLDGLPDKYDCLVKLITEIRNVLMIHTILEKDFIVFGNFLEGYDMDHGDYEEFRQFLFKLAQFFKNQAQSLKFYISYVEKYSAFKPHEADFNADTNKKVKKIMFPDPNDQKMTVSFISIEPVQRVTRYVMMLDNLLSSAKSDTEVFTQLSIARNTVNQITTAINYKSGMAGRYTAALERVKETSLPRTMLAEIGQFLQFEGVIQDYPKKKNRRFIMTERLLLVCGEDGTVKFAAPIAKSLLIARYDSHMMRYTNDPSPAPSGHRREVHERISQAISSAEGLEDVLEVPVYGNNSDATLNGSFSTTTPADMSVDAGSSLDESTHTHARQYDPMKLAHVPAQWPAHAEFPLQYAYRVGNVFCVKSEPTAPEELVPPSTSLRRRSLSRLRSFISGGSDAGGQSDYEDAHDEAEGGRGRGRAKDRETSLPMECVIDIVCPNWNKYVCNDDKRLRLICSSPAERETFLSHYLTCMSHALVDVEKLLPSIFPADPAALNVSDSATTTPLPTPSISGPSQGPSIVHVRPPSPFRRPSSRRPSACSDATGMHMDIGSPGGVTPRRARGLSISRANSVSLNADAHAAVLGSVRRPSCSPTTADSAAAASASAGMGSRQLSATGDSVDADPDAPTLASAATSSYAADHEGDAHAQTASPSQSLSHDTATTTSANGAISPRESCSLTISTDGTTTQPTTASPLASPPSDDASIHAVLLPAPTALSPTSTSTPVAASVSAFGSTSAPFARVDVDMDAKAAFDDPEATHATPITTPTAHATPAPLAGSGYTSGPGSTSAPASARARAPLTSPSGVPTPRPTNPLASPSATGGARPRPVMNTSQSKPALAFNIGSRNTVRLDSRKTNNDGSKATKAASGSGIGNGSGRQSFGTATQSGMKAVPTPASPKHRSTNRQSFGSSVHGAPSTGLTRPSTAHASTPSHASKAPAHASTARGGKSVFDGVKPLPGSPRVFAHVTSRIDSGHSLQVDTGSPMCTPPRPKTAPGMSSPRNLTSPKSNLASPRAKLSSPSPALASPKAAAGIASPRAQNRFASPDQKHPRPSTASPLPSSLRSPTNTTRNTGASGRGVDKNGASGSPAVAHTQTHTRNSVASPRTGIASPRTGITSPRANITSPRGRPSTAPRSPPMTSPRSHNNSVNTSAASRKSTGSGAGPSSPDTQRTQPPSTRRRPVSASPSANSRISSSTQHTRGRAEHASPPSQVGAPRRKNNVFTFDGDRKRDGKKEKKEEEEDMPELVSTSPQNRVGKEKGGKTAGKKGSGNGDAGCTQQ